MEMGAMVGEDVVKDLCDALATNVYPEEHFAVHLLFQNLRPNDFRFEFEVGKISKGENIVLSQGTGSCRGHKKRLDIVRAICNSPKHIVEIVVGYEFLSYIELYEKKIVEEWCELMLGLTERSTLHSLTLNIHVRKTVLYDKGVGAMCNMLAHHPSLRHLTLKGWRIQSNKIAASLAEALSMKEKIETFTLDDCSVTSIALDILLQPLIPNESGIQSKIQGLSLLDFWINGNSVGKVIGNMLQKNTTLCEFGVGFKFPYVYGETFKEIFKALKENQHLKGVKFQGCHFDGSKIFAEVMELLQKNPSLKVHLHDTGLYGGQNRRFVQDLVRRNEQYMAVLNDSFQTITPTSARVFFCGFPHAGKTTLRKQLAKTSLLSKMNQFQKARFKLHRERSSRTIGIEVEMVDTTDSITLQLWDLGGQDEFHALHDLVVPNVGDNGLGARCIFILVCSLMNSPHNTTLKEEQNIKQELQYWLKFILSNSTWSPMTCKPHVIIAFTHIDLAPKNLNTEDYVKELMGSLRKFCGNSIDIFEQGVFHVNAKSQRSIIQLATYVDGDVFNLLKNGPKVNEACLTMEVALAKLNKTKPHKPFLKWEEFILLCKEQEAFIAMFDEDLGGLQIFCKALVVALHDSGHVMYFESLEFVVVDPNWFCNKVLGPMLSRVDEVAHDAHKGKTPRSNDGYMEGKVFKSILEDSFLDKKNVRKGMKEVEGVEMDDVIELMKKMNLCYWSNSNVA